jgi:hypothetical protein
VFGSPKKVRGKIVSGKIVRGKIVWGKWMESEMIVLVVWYQW